jgi:hypothetical protein
MAGSFEHGNESSSSVKGGEFLDRVRNYQIARKNSAPWNWLF